MAKNGIPVFKPSGQGLMADLKNIKVSEMISWGAYKGKFAKLSQSVCGSYTDADGVKVYGVIPINGNTNNQNSQTSELLKMLGFTASNLSELANAWNSGDLAYIRTTWEGTGIISEDAYELWLQKIGELMSLVTTFEIYGCVVKYDSTVYTTPAQRIPLFIFDNSWNVTPFTSDTTIAPNFTFDLIEDWDIQTNIEKVFKERLTNVLNIKIFDGTTDITASFPVEFREMLIAICLMNPNSAFTKISSSSYEVTGTGTFIEVHQTETYDNLFDKSFFTGKYLNFSVDDPNQSDPKYRIIKERITRIGSWSGTSAYFKYYWANLWAGRDNMRADDLFALTNELFKYTINDTINLSDGSTIEIRKDKRMTVDGFRKSNYRDFGFYVSEFMKIESEEESDGWFIDFIMGLVNAFLSLLDALLNFLDNIPIISDLIDILVSIVAKIFGMSFEEMKAFIRTLIKAIIIAIAVYYAPMLIGEAAGAAGGIATNLMAGLAAGAMTIPQMLSIGIELYSMVTSSLYAAEQAGAEEERKQKELENSDKELNPETQAFMGTLGSYEQHQSSDNLMYYLMFNPLESLVFGELPPVYGENNKE